MPFINVHIGKELTEQKKVEVMEMIAKNMPIIPGKTSDNTMIEISAGRDMYMSLEKKPLIFVDMRVMGPAPTDKKDEFIKTLAKGFEDILDIPGDKLYFNLQELYEWGTGSGLSIFPKN